MSVQSDLGPNGQPRWRIYQQARELRALAELALECAAKGPGGDLPRAVATLDRMRAVLGEGMGDA